MSELNTARNGAARPASAHRGKALALHSATWRGSERFLFGNFSRLGTARKSMALNGMGSARKCMARRGFGVAGQGTVSFGNFQRGNARRWQSPDRHSCEWHGLGAEPHGSAMARIT